MDKIIVTALLLIGGVVSAVAMFNAIYPAMTQSNQAMVGMERRIDDQMKTQVDIIHAAKSGSTVLLWVKNVGSLRVIGVDFSDLFFGPEGAFVRIPYGTGTPHWEYTVENGGEWTPGATIRITVVDATLNPGRYFCKFVLPNGITSEYFLSW